jgi:L-ascorbate metabolism protein UlaG (beta-lactamase superfamily)
MRTEFFMRQKYLPIVAAAFCLFSITATVPGQATDTGRATPGAKSGGPLAYIFTGTGYEYRTPTARELESAVLVRFLGNCGYLISGGGKSILVDALFRHPNPMFAHVRTPNDVFEKMLAGEEPFRKIDLVLVSHYHADHFTSDMAFPFLMKHPETRMIANEHTLSLAEENDPENYGKVRQQIDSLTQGWGEVREVRINGCPLKLYLVKHTPDDRLARELIVTQYLIELGGVKFLHMGDMDIPSNMEYFRNFGLEKEGIDVVFKDNWNTDAGKVLMNEFVKPKLFIVMHNNLHSEGPYYRSALEAFPNTTIFIEPMEEKIFIKAKN